jgi:hypothetical protein
MRNYKVTLTFFVRKIGQIFNERAGMSLTETLVKTITLGNGSELKLYDRSQKIAGDRWRVSLIARMEVPISCMTSAETVRVSATVDEIKSALGAYAVFEYKSERNFVAEKKKDEIFNGLCDSFLKSSLSYLSHCEFPARFIVKSYKTYIKKTILSGIGK